MEINKYLTQTNYDISKNRKIKWLVIHYTANTKDTAWGNCNYFHKTYRGASAHYFVDENEVWQCVDDNNIAWHCGAKITYNECRNVNSIGIELCSMNTKEDKTGKFYFKDGTVSNAIQLVKMLMKKYDIDINHVCMHYDVTRKKCPAPFVDNDTLWQDFKNKLQKSEGDIMLDKLIGKYGADSVEKALVRLIETVNDDGKEAEWATEEYDEAKELGITDGSNPEMYATRQEVAIMIKRAVSK